jgi:hypothetical protein
MRTSLLVSLLFALCILIGVGPAAASNVNYPDGTSSLAINLGNGQHAFVFFNNLVPPDIFIHSVGFFADLVSVQLSSFVGFAFWLEFEGFNQGFQQFGVYTCNTSNLVSCNVSGTRRGTFFL